MHPPTTTYKKRPRDKAGGSQLALSKKRKKHKSTVFVSDEHEIQLNRDNQESVHAADASSGQNNAIDSQTARSSSVSGRVVGPFAPCLPRSTNSGETSSQSGDSSHDSLSSKTSSPTPSAPTAPNLEHSTEADDEDAPLSKNPKQSKHQTIRGRQQAAELTLSADIPEGIKPEHLEMLSNRWLSAVKLNEMAKDEGLFYKKGKFTAVEERLITATIEEYRAQRQLTGDDITNIVHPPERKNHKDNDFWFKIAAAVPGRPVISVYHYLRRSMHSSNRMGPWKPEEDARLKDAVTSWGQQWEKVSESVGRSGPDCRDRYRNHLVGKNVRKQGIWSKQEEDKLEKIVQEMEAKMGKKSDGNIFWARVAERMGQTRNRQQCQQKWVNQLALARSSRGGKRDWTNMDFYILFHKVDSIGVRDDTEIDWKILLDEDWDYWSPAILSKHWARLKRSVEGHGDLTHANVMDRLRAQWATAPEEKPAKPRKTSRPISAETIEDESEDDSAAVPATTF